MGGAERWVLRGLLGSSPARVGSRLASEGQGAPEYSSSRQGCRESWLSAWLYRRGWAGLGRVPRPGSPWPGPRNQPVQSLPPDHLVALLRGAPASP